MTRFAKAAVTAISAAFCLTAVFAQSAAAQDHGSAIITVLSKKNRELPVNLTQQDLRLKVDGKDADITGWTHLNTANGPVELVLLIDGSARTSLGQQLGDISNFIQSLPADVKLSVGYMEFGRAVLSGAPTTDRNVAQRALHLPSGPVGGTGSPYFCLSDLAKHWPGSDTTARRVVVMVTDGVDNYEQHFDPEDPYVQAAITDSVRAGLIISTIYWRDRGFLDSTEYGADSGQNLMAMVTDATGGSSYWNGMGNPVSFKPYFDDVILRLKNQYRLSFTTSRPTKTDVVNMSLKVGGPASKVWSPQQVAVHKSGSN